MDLEKYQRAVLRQHIGHENISKDMALQDPSRPAALKAPISFIVERSPPSVNPSRCSLPSCSRTFVSGQYRVAISPAINEDAAQNADLYHVSCFEKIADLSDSAFLERIEPFTRLNCNNRPYEDYICAGAVERLVIEWKTRRIRWNNIMKSRYEKTESNFEDDDDLYDDDRNESEDEDEDVDEEIFSNANIKNNRLNERLLDDLMHNAGSSRFKPYGLVPGMQRQQYFLFLKSLAPWESDGPGDNEEWNLFDTFLGKEEPEWPSIQPKVSLSAVLEKWEKYAEVVLKPDASLSNEQQKEKSRIGEKGCRAIRRLAVIPMQQIPWEF